MSVEVGQKVEGKVTGITNFGAFVSLPENQSGLVHISEVAEGFVKDINDVLTVGDTVMVKVLKINPDGKINLSIRQASDKPEVAKAPVNDKVPYQAKRPAPKPRFDEKPAPKLDDFDAMMNQFLKDSEDRLTSLKRSTEGKRGGRGGRRG